MRRGVPRTWWGSAWVDALTARGADDLYRVERGREYARTGRVRALDVRPGTLSASVRGSRLVPYEVTVAVPVLPGEAWEAALDVVAARASYTAALLDGDLPPELAADLGAAGVALLPAAGELSPSCSCPDDAALCKHAAAACLVFGDELDRDPFELLLLRGRGRAEVLSALRARRGGGGDVADLEVDAEVEAAEAFLRPVGPLPPLPLPPAKPGRPAPLTGEPPEGTVRTDELQALVADAAARAWELLAAGGDGGLGLTQEQDLARRAVPLAGSRALAAMAARAKVPPAVLARRALAWQYGGAGALRILDDDWTPDYGDLAEGIAALGTGGHVSRNRVSDAADVRQLRLGRDGLWYPMRRVGGAWEVTGPPSADPREVV